MQKIIFISLALGIMAMIGCGDKPNRPAPALNAGTTVADPVPALAPVPASTGGGSGVFHYTCATQNCSGQGSDIAGNCTVCGQQLMHNQAWHNTPQGQASTPNPGVNTQTTTIPEPAQNTAGTWHYTCSNGCTGGAGSAVACGTCGSTLVHNTTYHN